MGQMNPERFVFYPYDESGLAITTEEQLVEELPEYFDRFLAPDREPLARRPGIRGRTDCLGSITASQMGSEEPTAHRL